jgi:CHASE2 domain-containing sensor protein
VNIGEGDRVFFAKIIQALIKKSPKVIALNAFLLGEKSTHEDSTLKEAFKDCPYDVVCLTVDSLGYPSSIPKLFSPWIDKLGLIKYEEKNGLISRFKPIIKIDGKLYESFALEITKRIFPHSTSEITVDKQYRIEYTRTSENFYIFDGNDVIMDRIEDELIKNKVVLLGYLGPSDEDKYYTPVRYFRYYRPEDPDMYGTVIIANQINTLNRLILDK